MYNDHDTFWISRRDHLFGLIMAPLYDGAGDGGAGGQGGEGGGEGGDGGEGGKEGGGDKVTLTQAELDNIIKGKVAGELEKDRKKRANVSAQELEELRKFKADKDREDLEKKGKYDEALKSVRASVEESYKPQLAERDTKIGSLTDRLRQEVITSKLLSAASDGNAVNADQVVELNQKFVKLDDDFNPIVVDRDGNQRFVAGAPMTPKQLIDEFLKQNPNHVKAQTGRGGGAGGGKTLATGEPDGSELQKLEAEVKRLADEVVRTGTPRAIAAHSAKQRELDAAKSKQAA